jgi:hypothetical protein
MLSLLGEIHNFTLILKSIFIYFLFNKKRAFIFQTIVPNHSLYMHTNNEFL